MLAVLNKSHLQKLIIRKNLVYILILKQILLENSVKCFLGSLGLFNVFNCLISSADIIHVNPGVIFACICEFLLQ